MPTSSEGGVIKKTSVKPSIQEPVVNEEATETEAEEVKEPTLIDLLKQQKKINKNLSGAK